MSISQDLHLTKRFIYFTRVSSLIVMSLGVIVLAGWVLDLGILKSLLPGLPTMKANTAIALVLAGVALWFTGRENGDSVSLRSAQFCGGAAGLLGLLTVGEYLFGWDAGIDQLIFLDLQIPQAAFPGRMALATAFCFMLIGIAFILINSRSGKAVGVGQYFAAA
ncbi:MAG TPA: hypothetical protein VN653_04845, partial [Anaerolineales bacterium]|nr:hypothetical protein [Anaerolineales bacterium]